MGLRPQDSDGLLLYGLLLGAAGVSRQANEAESHVPAL